jgi:quercetin dioxygenase-like cupin family protein
MTLEVRSLESADLTFSPEKLSKISLFETPRFFADLYGLLPGQEQRLHLHDGNDKMYVCLEGEVTATVGEDHAKLVRGQAVLAPAGARHAVRNDSAERAVLLVVMAPNPNAS